MYLIICLPSYIHLISEQRYLVKMTSHTCTYFYVLCVFFTKACDIMVIILISDTALLYIPLFKFLQIFCLNLSNWIHIVSSDFPVNYFGILCSYNGIFYTPNCNYCCITCPSRRNAIRICLYVPASILMV